MPLSEPLLTADASSESLRLGHPVGNQLLCREVHVPTAYLHGRQTLQGMPAWTI